LTATEVGGSGNDIPTAMGAANATLVGGYVSLLGDPAGGGIAVDHTARVNVVGSTLSTDYPVTGAGVFPAGRAKPAAPLNEEAVRTVFDLLPAGVSGGVPFAVGRTDGTGPPPVGGPTLPGTA